MRKIGILTLGLFYHTLIFGQPQYVKTLAIGGNDYAQTSTTTSDTGIVIASFDYNNFNSVISKVNKTGMVEWSETTETWIQLRSSTQYNNLIFFAGINYSIGYVLAIDESGQKLWSKEVTSPNSLNSYVADITSDSNNLFLLIGSQPFISLGDSSTYATLCQMDLMGNIIWQKTYDVPGYPQKLIYNAFTQKLLFTVNSSFYYAPPVRIIETDLSGNVAWAKSYPDLITNVACTPSSGYVYTGVDYSTEHSLIFLTNQTGDIYLKREFWDSTFTYDPTIMSLFVSGSGSIYVGTYTSSPAVAPPAALIKFDQNGNLLLSNSYFGYSTQETGIRNISSNLQGGLYLTGTRPSQFFSETTFCICSDTMGQAGCDVFPLLLFDNTSIASDTLITVQYQVLPVSINALSDLLALIPVNQSFDCTTGIEFANASSSVLNLFPNPSDGNIELKYNLSNESSIEIYNLFGQLVWKNNLHPGDTKVSFTLPLAEGFYSWRVESTGIMLESGKIEIIH